jgi:hypothetical protein
MLAWVLLIFAAPALIGGFVEIGCRLGLGLGACDNAILPASLELPPAMQFVFSHQGDLALASFVQALIEITAGIGLLRRLEWARRLVLALLAWNVVVAFASAFAFRITDESLVTNLLVALLFSLVYGWIFFRLRSIDVRAQFHKV